MKKIAAIVLAAGRGKRMKSTRVNKVVASLGNKQMVLHTVDKLRELLIAKIVVVVGFAKESVMEVLGGRVVFANQSKRLGTAHAVLCALRKLPRDIQTVLILNGDDSAFYRKDTIRNLIRNHLEKNAALSFLTIIVDNPVGLGRVIRNSAGKVIGIAEEKDATGKQRKIREINPACYVFEVSFLKKYLKKIKKSPVSGEYYLTSLIDIAINNNQKINAVIAGKIFWQGINTREELKKAQELFLDIK